MARGRQRLPPDTGKVLKRPPAWTDRVLFRSADAGRVRVEALAYRRHELLGSDHRPVSALLHVSWNRTALLPAAVAPCPGHQGSNALSAAAAVGGFAAPGLSENAPMGGVSVPHEHETGSAPPLPPPTAVLFEFADELVVADKRTLLAAGIDAWPLQAKAGGSADRAGHAAAQPPRLLRVCKTRQGARRTDVDEALKAKMLAAALPSTTSAGATVGAAATEIYGVLGIAGMSFMPYLIVVTNVSEAAYLPQGRALRVTDTHIVCASRNTLPDSMEDERAIDEKEFSHLKEISAGWGLFFSPDFDITQTQQRLAAEGAAAERRRRRASDLFVWNSHLLKPLVGASAPPLVHRHADGQEQAGEDVGGIPDAGHGAAGGQPEAGPALGGDLEAVHGMVHDNLLSVVCGFVETVAVQVKDKRVNVTVVSRRSRFRSGVRFFSRGVDDAGHVSNSVESEQVVTARGGVTSFVTVRGSIPLYWQEQEALVTLKPKPLVLAGKPHEQALARHLADLSGLYGPVMMLSLIDSHGNEGNIYQALSHLATRALQTRDTSVLAGFLPFDFHAECGKSASAKAAKRIARVPLPCTRAPCTPIDWH